MLRFNRSLALGLIFVLIAAALHAQSPPEASPDNTLHLYTRIVELPTIVLRPSHPLLPSLDPKRVNIKLDLNPTFHPTSIRLEGDDPISLAILIDTRGHPFLLPPLQAALSTWLTASFQPQDRISLYAMNCHLIQSAHDDPPNPALLQPIFDSLLTRSEADTTRSHADCPNPVGPREAIYFAMRQLAQRTGRRALLMVTNGGDDKGTVKWSDLTSYATLCAVTIFGINAPDPTLYQWSGDFNDLSQRSGGFYVITPPGQVSDKLSRIIQLLRQRYILQFSMPSNLTSGVHLVYVTIDNTTAIIRPSGITVPINDPSTHTGPVNIPLGSPAANPIEQPTAPPIPPPNN